MNEADPSCTDRICGTTAAGNSCGTCSAKQTCTDAGLCVVDAPASATCPAVGRVGSEVGNVVQPGTIPLAQGGAYAIESSCGRPIYVLGVTETCSICMDHLGQWSKAGGFFDQLKAEGVDVILVSTDDSQGRNGSVQTAEALRKRFQLGVRFIVGYEPLGRDSFESFVALRTRYAGARISLLVTADNVIGAVGQIDDEHQVRSALGVRGR